MKRHDEQWLGHRGGAGAGHGGGAAVGHDDTKKVPVRMARARGSALERLCTGHSSEGAGAGRHGELGDVVSLLHGMRRRGSAIAGRWWCSSAAMSA